MLLEVVKKASDNPNGDGVYRFGCDWRGCPESIEAPGERASEAAHHLKKHGSWGSRSVSGLYCETHTPLAREKAAREARGAVIEPLDEDALAATAARCLEEGYLFGENSDLAETAGVSNGCATLETSSGRKFLLSVREVSAENNPR